MKTKNRAFIWSAISCLSTLLLVACSKPTINGAPLPTFYGLFAIDQNKLTQITPNEIPNLSSSVQFVIFDKTVALAGDAKFYSIGFDTEPRPADDGSFSWPKFMQSVEAYQRSTDAVMTGIPQTATPIETHAKPVEKQPEMMVFLPAVPFKPGLYQLQNVAKFWIEREKYQTTAESNAKQSLQAENWVDASRLASIALLVGPSKPSLKDELTQIKFRALTKRSSKALSQDNFDLAESFARCGNDLQPPSPFDSEFRNLLGTEIPFRKAMKLARAATQDESWDLVMQAGEMALKLKPDDSQAKAIVFGCPKVLLPAVFNLASQDVHTYFLRFSADSKRLIARIDNNDYFTPTLLHAWNLERRSEIPGLQLWYEQKALCITPDGERILRVPRDDNPPFFEGLFDTNVPKQVIASKLIPDGFSKDGSIYWTATGPEYGAFPQQQMKARGLMPLAKELGLLGGDGFLDKMKAHITISDAKTFQPLTVLGGHVAYDWNPEGVIANDGVLVLFQKNAQGTKPPACLSAWDIKAHILLSMVELDSLDFSLWCFGSDGKRPIVWMNDKFWLWNRDTKVFEAPFELPTKGNHIVAFTQNGRGVADRSTTDPYIRICDFETGKVLCKFKEALGISITQMVFSPDNSYVATTLNRQQNLVALWRIPDDVKVALSK